MNIKERVYNALLGLGIKVIDNPYDRGNADSFPFIIFRTNSFTVKETNELTEETYVYLVDIYSEYEGEKEIYEIYNHILILLKELYEDPKVVRVLDNGIKIVDDKNLGPTLKHGILTFSIKTMERSE